MKKIIFLLLCIPFCWACEANKSPRPFAGDRQFQTTDPARLYFKNIKSIAYYRTRKPHSEIDIYQARKSSRIDKRPILYTQILDNWLDNEAYIFLEKNAFPNFASPLTIKAESDTLSKIFDIDVFSKKKQYEFAENLFKALNNKQKLSVKTKEESFVPIFQNYQDKANFMMTMKDYYRLIDLERKRKLKKTSKKG